MRHILLCTVGTSLLNNIINCEHIDMKEALKKGNYKQVALSLLEHDPSHRLCGAEINSNTSIFNKKLMNTRQKLYLLISDTSDGEKTGAILKMYYQSARNPFKFEQVECVKIAGLKDSNPQQFKTEGLRNLVKKISGIVRKNGKQYVLINATGGYKAQISFAGMIGQALQIPVCYLFEKFSEIIEMPPQPISFDLSFWLENVALFYELDKCKIGIDITSLNQRFSTLIEEIVEGEENLVCLSATGQLFHEAFRQHFSAKKEQLLPLPCSIAPENKVINFEDSNPGKHRGLENYLKRLLELSYVKRIYTHYYNPDLPRNNCFRISTKGDCSHIEGIYSDGKGTTKFDLITTARSTMEQKAILADLLSINNRS